MKESYNPPFVILGKGNKKLLGNGESGMGNERRAKRRMHQVAFWRNILYNLTVEELHGEENQQMEAYIANRAKVRRMTYGTRITDALVAAGPFLFKLDLPTIAFAVGSVGALEASNWLHTRNPKKQMERTGVTKEEVTVYEWEKYNQTKNP